MKIDKHFSASEYLMVVPSDEGADLDNLAMVFV
jgi:hypothetical protein